MKKENRTAIEMGIGVLLYGAFMQLLLLVLPMIQRKLWSSIGLWLGIIGVCLMIWHMNENIQTAVDLGEKYAKNHGIKSYLIRYGGVILLIAGVYYTKIGSVQTLFLGMIGLKMGAYLQPLIHRMMKKRR